MRLTPLAIYMISHSFCQLLRNTREFCSTPLRWKQVIGHNLPFWFCSRSRSLAQNVNRLSDSWRDVFLVIADLKRSIFLHVIWEDPVSLLFKEINFVLCVFFN